MQYLRRQKPAVVFVHLEKPSLLAIIGGLLVGYRRIVPCIHIDLIAYANTHHSILNRLRRWLLNSMVALLYRLTPWVIVVSEGAGQTARRLLSPFGPPVRWFITVWIFRHFRPRHSNPLRKRGCELRRFR